MVMPTEELAIKAALRMCPDLAPENAVIVRITDTLHLNRMWLSPAARTRQPERSAEGA
jgi:hypothetical protein